MDETCPNCGLSWPRSSLVGEVSRDDGYRIQCGNCGHEWDDRDASHGERETRRRAEQRLSKLFIVAPDELEESSPLEGGVDVIAVVMLVVAGAIICAILLGLFWRIA